MMAPPLWHAAEMAPLNHPQTATAHPPHEPTSTAADQAAPVPDVLPTWDLAREMQAARASETSQSPCLAEWRGIAEHLWADHLMEESNVVDSTSSATPNPIDHRWTLPKTVLPVHVHQATPIRPSSRKAPAVFTALPWPGLSHAAALDLGVAEAPSPPPRRRNSRERVGGKVSPEDVLDSVMPPSVVATFRPPASLPPSLAAVDVKSGRSAAADTKPLPVTLTHTSDVTFSISGLVGQDLMGAPSPSPPSRRRRRGAASPNVRGAEKENECDAGLASHHEDAKPSPRALVSDGLFALSPLSTRFAS